MAYERPESERPRVDAPPLFQAPPQTAAEKQAEESAHELVSAGNRRQPTRVTFSHVEPPTR